MATLYSNWAIGGSTFNPEADWRTETEYRITSDAPNNRSILWYRTRLFGRNLPVFNNQTLGGGARIDSGTWRQSTLTTNVRDTNHYLIREETIYIPHNSDGTKSIYFQGRSALSSVGTYMLTPNTLLNLPLYPQYVTLNSFTATVTSSSNISVGWSAADFCDRVEYSLNNGAWVLGQSGSRLSGSFNISGLTQATTYTIRIRVRRTVGQLYTTSSTLTRTTQGAFATITEFSPVTISLQTIAVTWNASHACDEVQYRLNGGAWVTGFGYPTFNINGLNPNTTYNVQIRVKRTDSQLWTESTTLARTTLDIARFTSVPDNIDIDQPFTIEFNRNGATSVKLGIYGTDGITELVPYREVTGSSYTFDLTTNEKNALFNNMSTVTTKIQRIAIRTNDTGDWSIGSDKTFRITNANPVFDNFTYQDANSTTLALTGNNQTIIKGYSNLRAIISTANKAVAQKGATMVSYQLVVGAKQITQPFSASETVNLDLSAIDNNVFMIYAVDSRGLSTMKQISPASYIEYVKPVILSSEVNRTGGIGEETTLKFNGSFFNANFGADTNNLTITYKYKLTSEPTTWTNGTTTITPTIDGDSFSFENIVAGDLGALGFDSSESYDIQVIATDDLSSVTDNLTLGTGTPNIAIHREGVAINAPYDDKLDPGLQVTGKIYLNGAEFTGGGGGGSTTIIDNLESTSSTAALSANQGRVLNQNKVDKVVGKGLSTEDYTSAEKSKLAGIATGAEVNVNADWNAVSGDAQILNKPTLAANTTATSNQFFTAYNSSTGAFTRARPTWANIDRTTSNIADITTRSHTSLTDIGTNTHAQIDTAIGTISSKANDADVVKLTGNQTVAGIKTFSSFPVTPSSAPTADFQVANRKFVLDSITAGGGYTDEQAQDAVGAMVTGNTETGISVTYDDAGNKLNFIVSTEDNLTSTSTTNPLSANQGKLLNDKFTKHIITANQSGRPIVNIATAFGASKIPFDSGISVGTKLTFDNANDRVIIGAGASKVKISGKANIFSAPATSISEVAIYIRKNGTNVANCLQSRISGIGFNDEVVSDKIISVAENDHIEMFLSCSTTGNYTIIGDNLTTYLTVEVVE